jgi:ubiquinone/menaquinone biosynthesis C-methylase UbiE
VPDERGLLFDRIAADYDRVRSDYPAEIVDGACAIARLERGSHVVEIGCGTGKLTEALPERALHVEAVDPGAKMIEVARRRVGSGADVTFHVGRFEDVELAAGSFAAAFSATAFHWVDPAIGWAKVADVLQPGGVFALLTHMGFSPLDEQIHAVWTDVRPESLEWMPRDRETFFNGIEARLGNVSEAWAWLNQRAPLARPEAAELFTDVRLTTAASDREETAERLVAVTRTTSMYLSLDPDERLRLEQGLTAVVDGAGGSFAVTLYAVLVTARRAARRASRAPAG